MEIVEQVKVHDITDYDFMFNSGNKLAVTIDHDAGDKVEEGLDRYVLSIAAKPSLSDPNESIDAEDITVYKTTLACAVVRKRKQRMPTVEEVLETQKYIHELMKTIQ